MTCAFTREFGSVIACDLDQGFLERCYETVGRFGKTERLRTLEVADGRTLDLPPNSVDVAFSYITLQHCNEDDALELASEAVRVVQAGRQGRAQLPRAGGERSGRRAGRRGGPQHVPRAQGRRLAVAPANGHPARLAGVAPPSRPGHRAAAPQLTGIEVWTNPKSKLDAYGATMRTFEGVNPYHWWLVATVT